MFRPIPLAAAVLIAGISAAVAQPAPPPPAPPPAPEASGGAMGGPMGGPMERMRHGPMHSGMMGMMHGSRGAHFVFGKGDQVADIRCADNEPTRACVDAASALMDKLAAQPR
jgi:hypothetical protein